MSSEFKKQPSLSEGALFSLKAESLLAVQEKTRKTKRFSLPPASLVVHFETITNNILQKLPFDSVNDREMISFFGTNVIVISKLWELIINNNNDDKEMLDKIECKKEHMLWALHFLKQHPNE